MKALQRNISTCFLRPFVGWVSHFPCTLLCNYTIDVPFLLYHYLSCTGAFLTSCLFAYSILYISSGNAILGLFNDQFAGLKLDTEFMVQVCYAVRLSVWSLSCCIPCFCLSVSYHTVMLLSAKTMTDNIGLFTFQEAFDHTGTITLG